MEIDGVEKQMTVLASTANYPVSSKILGIMIDPINDVLMAFGIKERLIAFRIIILGQNP